MTTEAWKSTLQDKATKKLLFHQNYCRVESPGWQHCKPKDHSCLQSQTWRKRLSPPTGRLESALSHQRHFHLQSSGSCGVFVSLHFCTAHSHVEMTISLSWSCIMAVTTIVIRTITDILFTAMPQCRHLYTCRPGTTKQCWQQDGNQAYHSKYSILEHTGL